MPEVLAPAKINLCLRVGSRRPDGYHPLCTLMEKVDLYDRLSFEEGASGVTVTDGGGVTIEAKIEANTVNRALEAIEAEAGKPLSVGIRLEKRIPIAAGLAGGSSDAAAVIRALTQIFSLDIPDTRQAAIAFEIGADVPFFLTSGPCLATGAGEQLEPVPDLPAYTIVLVNPGRELSTAAVYERFDRDGGGGEPLPAYTERLRDVLAAGPGIHELADLMVNDLEFAAISMEPAISIIRDELLGLGALGALMSGSGPTVLGLFPDEQGATRAADSLAAASKRVWVLNPLR